MPQWQIKMQILGSSPLTSFSGGYSFTLVSVFLAGASRIEASPAAPLACITVSGMSFGEEKAPQTNIPGLEVSIGEWSLVLQNPY